MSTSLRGSAFGAGACSVVFSVALILFLTSHGAYAFADYCGECDPARDCPAPPADCAALTLDACNCCVECARLAGESCQGLFGELGRCAEGLECHTLPAPGMPISEHDEGICVPQDLVPACNVSACALELLHCPPDSLPQLGEPRPGQCCPEPPSCQCRGDCQQQAVTCPPGFLKVKVVTGLGVPGQCCNVFECRPREAVCGGLVCPEERFANLTCPPDSRELPPVVTHNGCCRQQRCECEHVFECAPVVCAAGQVPEQVHRATGLPGDCCDLWRCNNSSASVCAHGGDRYADGESRMIDTCVRITCRQGILHLEDLSASCPVPTNCEYWYKPQGQCCLQCKGCMDDGRGYENGEEWQKDECTVCRCEGGQKHCMVEECLFTHCPHRVRVPGQCCPMCLGNDTVQVPPHCPPLRLCPAVCPRGFAENEFGCPVCKCKLPEVVEQCVLPCPLGYLTDEDGNSLCQCIPPEAECPPMPANCTQLQCLYGYRRDEAGCPRCKCRKCAQDHCAKTCAHGYERNDQGCKICKCKAAPGVELPTTAAPTDGSVAVVPPGRGASPVCLSAEGHLMQEGQSWHDGCRRCFCHGGQEMCELITCAAPNCSNPFIRHGDCCPSCHAVDVLPVTTTSCALQNGRILREGETWAMDNCTLCICHDGALLCDVERCPPVLCHQPYKTHPHACCPICPEEGTTIPAGLPIGDSTHKPCMSVSGYVYAHRDTWKVSACQSCVCRDGQIHCFAQSCPPLDCQQTTLLKGHCCPVCMDWTQPVSSQCVHAGETYEQGERWMTDACTECACLGGQKACSELLCAPLDTCPPHRHSAPPPGQCCPVCADEEAQDVERSDDSAAAAAAREDAYRAVIVALLVAVGMLVTTVILLVVCCVCCPNQWRRGGARGQQHHRRQPSTTTKISDFTQTNGEYKKRPISCNIDFKGLEVTYTNDKLEGITNTQMNEYTLMPCNGVNNEYSTLKPVGPGTGNDYATLNGISMQINEYTPLTAAESAESHTESSTDCQTDSQTDSEPATSRADSQTPIAEKMWRNSSAEDRTNSRVKLDMPDICDNRPGSRKSM